MPQTINVGRVVSIWRYPVKSMMGETLNATEVTAQGILGDRTFALVDVETGKVASAKNPRRWPNLFDFRAAFVEPPSSGNLLPTRITFPNGESAVSAASDIDDRLSNEVGRRVRLARSAVQNAAAEGYWPDHDWLSQRDQVFEFPLPAGTFFDGAAIHLLTTATLDRLRSRTPTSRFEIPRFRPNLVIEPTGGADGFVENAWIGKTMTLGDVQLRIDGPCPRCVMTTLSQDSLPKDPTVLRTVLQENEGNVGVYATVLRPGRVQRGNEVAIS